MVFATDLKIPFKEKIEILSEMEVLPKRRSLGFVCIYFHLLRQLLSIAGNGRFIR